MYESGGQVQTSVMYTPIDNSHKESLFTKLGIFGSLPKNVNLYWLSASGLGIWFLFMHTPIWFQTHIARLSDFPLIAHLIGIAGIYLACIMNTLITPSWNRTMHVWIGRVGLVLGFWGFPFGAYMTWTRPGPPLYLATYITVGGIMQMICQVMGYMAIKKYQKVKEQIINLPSDSPKDSLAELEALRIKHLNSHIGWMLGLFVVACGMPATMRFANISAPFDLFIANTMWCIVTTFYFMKLKAQPMNPGHANSESTLLIS